MAQMNGEDPSATWKDTALVLEIVDQTWVVVGNKFDSLKRSKGDSLKRNKGDKKETQKWGDLEICYLEKKKVWCLMSSVIKGGVLLDKIHPGTKMEKLANAFVHIDKYGVKFTDDKKADAFMKAVDKAKKGDPPSQRKRKPSVIATGTGSAGGSPRVSVAGGGGDIMQMLNEAKADREKIKNELSDIRDCLARLESLLRSSSASSPGSPGGLLKLQANLADSTRKRSSSPNPPRNTSPKPQRKAPIRPLNSAPTLNRGSTPSAGPPPPPGPAPPPAPSGPPAPGPPPPPISGGPPPPPTPVSGGPPPPPPPVGGGPPPPPPGGLNLQPAAPPQKAMSLAEQLAAKKAEGLKKTEGPTVGGGGSAPAPALSLQDQIKARQAQGLKKVDKTSEGPVKPAPAPANDLQSQLRAKLANRHID